MATSGTNWDQRGQRAVGAAADLTAGLIKGFRSIGGRIQAARYKSVIEAFCASSGLVAAQNGRLKREEIAGFRRFLVENRQHAVLGHFSPDELIDKFREYAIKAFLEDDDAFVAVLDQIPKQSEEAKLIVTGCLAVVYADGQCDHLEQAQMDKLARDLDVDLKQLSDNMQVSLPPAEQPAEQSPAQPAAQPAAPAPRGGSSHFTQSIASAAPPPRPVPAPSPMVQQPPAPSLPNEPPPPPAPRTPPPGKTACTFCSGKGCAFCGNTGYR